MRDTLTILSSSAALPPHATPLHPHHRSSSSSTTTTTKPRPKPKPKPSKPKPTGFTLKPKPSLLSPVPWNNHHSLKYYAELASKLAGDGRLQDFLMIAESVVGSGLEPSRFTSGLNVELVSGGIALLIDEGRLGGVVDVLNGVRKLGIDVLRLFDGVAMEALLRECSRIVKSGEVEEIVGFMEAFRGHGFSVEELVEPSEIIRVCVNKRKPSSAIRYCHIFSHAHIIWCTIILEFGKRGDLMSALTIFEASSQNQDCPNMYAYRTMIDACGLCGDYMKSRSIYEELIASKFAPNVYVFNSVMNVNAFDLSYTLRVYKQMQKLDVKADLVSYNILLKSCCLAGRVDLARDIYRKVWDLESRGLLKLDIFTYSTIIKVFANAKLWKMALKIKEDMLSAGVTPNSVTWSSLISACANAGLVEQAMKLFEEMLLAGCEPNMQCCNTLLHACVEACQYDRAFRIFSSWKEHGLLKGPAECFHVKTENNAGAKPIYENCSDTSGRLLLPKRFLFKPTTSTYNILMKACGSDYYRAKAWMDEMRRAGLSPNHISWSILIDICGSTGNVGGALQILRSMREGGVLPDVVTYTTAIKVCVECNNLKFAFSLYAEMKRYQIKPNMVTYNTLLRARSRYGSLQEVQQCLAIYQDMRRAGYQSNDHYLEQLIEEWCESVVLTTDQNKGKLGSRHRIDSVCQGLLLERVAELLQIKSESVSIDLQGLSKVEARIVVLAVLRMIKENNSTGEYIKDDVLIILSIHEADPRTNKRQVGVREAITKLLQHDLELEVLSSEPRTDNDNKSNWRNHSEESFAGLEEVEQGMLPAPLLGSATRKPANVQRLKITKESLFHWLKRRNFASAR